MAKSVAQVLVGTGTLYAAPVGETFPTNAETAPAGNWDDVGYTDDGVAFEWDLTFEDVTVAELANPISTRWTGAAYRLTAALAQTSLENIQLALNGGTLTNVAGPPVRKTYTPPAVGADTATALLFRFVNENGFHTDLQVPEARQTGSASIPFRKAPEKSVIAIEMTLQQPSSGDIFTFDEYVSAS